MDNKIDIAVFDVGEKSISLGCIPVDIITFLKEKIPTLSSVIKSDSEILFWADRVEHIIQSYLLRFYHYR